MHTAIVLVNNHIVLMDQTNIYRIGANKNRVRVVENHFVESTLLIDSSIYAMCKAHRARKAGIYFYDTASF